MTAPLGMPVNPDVFCIGSSVIALPLCFCDHPGKSALAYLQLHPMDRSSSIEQVLSALGVGSVSVWTAAGLGQSLEESADFVDKYLVGDKRPRVLVFWVAPGSFAPEHIDSETLCSKKLAWFLPDRTLFDPGSNLLQLFRWRSKAQGKCRLWTDYLYQRLHLIEPEWRRWERFQMAYAIKYSHKISSNRLATLKRVLDICDKRSISVLLVSTPLADQNRRLLKLFSYSDYAKVIAETVQDRASIIDFGQSSEFSSRDFFDGAHCNSSGGMKMIHMVTPKLVQLLKKRSGPRNAFI